MPYLCIVVNLPNETIENMNANCQFPTKVSESIQGAINYLLASESGTKAASVQITSRSTDPSISTAGTNSEQETYSHL